MDKLKVITAPAGEKFRQIQKIVHEIKNNDGGLMQRIKRITNKPPPNVPRRDYGSGAQDDETDNWSDEFGSDYDNPDDHSDRDETYVDPNDPDEQNYEPPPNEPEPRFTPSYKFSDKNGGYAEKDRNRQPPSTQNDMHRPTRPLPNPQENVVKPSTIHQVNNRLPIANKLVPRIAPKPTPASRQQPTSRPPAVTRKPVIISPQQQDDEDYIVPANEEDDNYIEPTASPKTPAPPLVNRATKPGQSPISRSPNHTEEPGVYEVPETEAKPSPPVREALAPPRKGSTPKQESQERFGNITETDRRPEPTKSALHPLPLPRVNVKLKQVLPKPNTPILPSRDVNSNIESPSGLGGQRLVGAGSEFPPTPPLKSPSGLGGQRLVGVGSEFPPTPPSRPEFPNRYVVNPSRIAEQITNKDAGVYNKDWYSSSCDRKIAEEALLASSKDGSFLVRKSTGQNQKQPFTLVVFYKRRVYNIPVRYMEQTQQYALGSEKSGEEKFNSVAEMIENHQRTNLVLIDSQTNTKDLTKLLHPVKV